MRRIRLLLLGLFALLPLALLAGCTVVDPLKRETCLAVVPALTGEVERIEITKVEVVETPAGGVRVGYRAHDGDRVQPGTVICGFGDPEGNGDTRALVSIIQPGGYLPPARFLMLKRFWVDKIDVRAAALAKLHVWPEARARGLVSLPREAALMVQHVVDAMAPTALYALTALAAALIWGLVGRINPAIGGIATIGAFGAVIAAVGLGTMGAGLGVGAVLAALVAATALAGAWGGAIGAKVVRPLAFRSAQPLLIATVGLSMALQEFLARTQGVRDVFLPPVEGRALLLVDGPFEVLVSPFRLTIVAIVAVVVPLVLIVFPRTARGREWRAVADDPFMARLVGIDPARVLVSTHALAAALAGLGGGITALAFGATSFHQGTVLGLKAIVAAVVGGAGSLGGAVSAAVAIGVIEAVWTVVWGGEWREAAVLAVLVAVLIARPRGIGRGGELPSSDRASR